MKKREVQNLRTKSVSELEKQVTELKSKLMVLSPKVSAGMEKNLKVKKNLKRDIAQLLSIIVEQKNNVKEEGTQSSK